jgi:hypothetical protein
VTESTDTAEAAGCSKEEMYLNIGLQALAFLLALVALARKPKLLWLYVAGSVLNLTVFRYNTCRNCVYYGKDCHLGWGLLTAKFISREGEPDCGAFSKRFPINLMYLMALYSFPIPAMRHNRKLLAAYFATLTAMNVAIPLSCRKCLMNDVCPLGEHIKGLLGD